MWSPIAALRPGQLDERTRPGLASRSHHGCPGSLPRLRLGAAQRPAARRGGARCLPPPSPDPHTRQPARARRVKVCNPPSDTGLGGIPPGGWPIGGPPGHSSRWNTVDGGPVAALLVPAPGPPTGGQRGGLGDPHQVQPQVAVRQLVTHPFGHESADSEVSRVTPGASVSWSSRELGAGGGHDVLGGEPELGLQHLVAVLPRLLVEQLPQGAPQPPLQVARICCVSLERDRRLSRRFSQQAAAGRGEPCRPDLRGGDETRACQARTRELVGEAQAVDDERPAEPRGDFTSTRRNCAEDRTVPIAQCHGRVHFRPLARSCALMSLLAAGQGPRRPFAGADRGLFRRWSRAVSAVGSAAPAPGRRRFGSE